MKKEWDGSEWIGRRVWIRGQRGSAVVELFYPDVKGGIKLESPIDGFYSWNIQDVRKWEPCS